VPLTILLKEVSGMQFLWKLHKQSKELFQNTAIQGNNKTGSNSLMTGAEKSFTEVSLFLVSMIFYLFSSFEEQHKSRS
jgi:hypothetical protein